MRVVFCFGGSSGAYNVPQGSVVRGIQLMKGLKMAGADVTIIFPNGKPRVVKGVNIAIGDYVTILKRIEKSKGIDVIYVRGHHLIGEIRKHFPRKKICLELYLNPYFPKIRRKDFSVYRFVDYFVVVGETYHKYSLLWLKELGAKHIRPNTIINPSYDEVVAKKWSKNKRIYDSCAFDAITYTHFTPNLVQAIANSGSSAVIGKSYPKNKEAFGKIRKIRWGNKKIKLVNAGINNIYSYYSKCLTAFALYGQPELFARAGNLCERDILVSNRIVEAIGNGCIPIVSKNVGNVDILGDRTDIFSTDNDVRSLTEKLNDVLNRYDYYKEELSKVDIEKFSNIKMGKKLYEFLKSVSK